jgi:hypothetical protein
MSEQPPALNFEEIKRRVELVLVTIVICRQRRPDLDEDTLFILEQLEIELVRWKDTTPRQVIPSIEIAKLCDMFAANLVHLRDGSLKRLNRPRDDSFGP